MKSRAKKQTKRHKNTKKIPQMQPQQTSQNKNTQNRIITTGQKVKKIQKQGKQQ